VEALRRLRVRPERAVAFEDSQAGVRAARAAGLAVVATASGWLVGDDLSDADLQLEHFGDAGALWDERHPLVRNRWLSARDLAAWHQRREVECTQRA
jgi:beta-phosphoglucomutase-like phosphatase (HAD superfamily)